MWIGPQAVEIESVYHSIPNPGSEENVISYVMHALLTGGKKYLSIQVLNLSPEQDAQSTKTVHTMSCSYFFSSLIKFCPGAQRLHC